MPRVPISYCIAGLAVSIVVGFLSGVMLAPHEGLGYTANGAPRPFNGTAAVSSSLVTLVLLGIVGLVLRRRPDPKT